LDKETLSVFLTHEFLMHYNPKLLGQMVLGNEVKLWVCKDSKLPMFSFGVYHGKSAENGMPMIGGNEVHIRLNKALWSEINKEDVVEDDQRRFIADIYRQVLSQVTDDDERFVNAELVEQIHDAHTMMTKLGEFIRGEISEKRTKH
jgi:hypothetical protein